MQSGKITKGLKLETQKNESKTDFKIKTFIKLNSEKTLHVIGIYRKQRAKEEVLKLK